MLLFAALLRYSNLYLYCQCQHWNEPRVIEHRWLLSSPTCPVLEVFTFANQAGLYMLVTTLVALQDITLDKMFDDHGKKNLCIEFPQTMQQFVDRVLHVYKGEFACQA
ncbi:homeobox-leucine zipper protein HOX29 isoform X3 [Capsicum annuum]|uniref:homeobox-leucine zipper protein HOX29 isoform X3 n=1 Tax=Capsicum annuum TaxID=4072 RepID=UPI0007BEFA11|nr:homeobox-leucine zipper protein HOX29 isoform X3 [Capsicum annuum]